MRKNEFLKMLRQRLGWTQAQLAKKVGRTPSCITNWETGYRTVNHQDAKKILKIAAMHNFNYSLDNFYQD